MSHWAHKRVKNKERVLNAAMQLFSARGFESTTVEDIAAETGVSRRSIYRYFGSKEGIFSYRQHAFLEGFQRLVAHPLPNETSYQTIRRACLALAEVFMQDRAMMVVQFEISRAASLVSLDQQHMLAWNESMVRALVRSGGKPSIRDIALAGAIIGMVRAILRAWTDDGAKDDLVALGKEAFESLESGFSQLRGQGVLRLESGVHPPRGIRLETES